MPASAALLGRSVLCSLRCLVLLWLTGSAVAWAQEYAVDDAGEDVSEEAGGGSDTGAGDPTPAVDDEDPQNSKLEKIRKARKKRRAQQQ